MADFNPMSSLVQMGTGQVAAMFDVKVLAPSLISGDESIFFSGQNSGYVK